MDLALILTPIFAFVLLKLWLVQRAEARSERVRLLEEALKNPAIDRATLERLTCQLTGVRAPRDGASRAMALLLAIGWLSLFAGGAMWVLGETIHESDATAAGIVVTIVGFGFVTYPFALRELEGRRAQH